MALIRLRRAALFGGFVAVVVSFSGCEEHAPRRTDACAEAVTKNLWCDARNVGFVAGVPIQSHLLFDALDAHGHELNPHAFTCPGCVEAIRTGGFCDKCRIGWVGGLAYFSRLTYHLARGHVVTAADHRCGACRGAMGPTHWCDVCKRGVVGNTIFDNRADFLGARRGFELMLTADEASRRCETCALAILANDSCFFCKVAYLDGKPVATARRN